MNGKEKIIKEITEHIINYSQNRLAIGEIYKQKDEIKNLSDTWMDLEDPEKKDLLLTTIENDELFVDLANAVKEKKCVFKVDEDMDFGKILNKITKNYDLFYRFISMLYVAVKIGIKIKEDDQFNDILKVYRISTWQQKNAKLVAFSFNIAPMFHRWDGETAMNTPKAYRLWEKLKRAERRMGPLGDWDLHQKAGMYYCNDKPRKSFWKGDYNSWQGAADYYLAQKEVILNATVIVKQLLVIEEEIKKYEEKFDNKIDIKKFIGTEEFDFEKLNEACHFLKSYKNGLLGNDAIIYVKEKFGIKKEIEIDCSCRYSEIGMYRAGKEYKYKFPACWNSSDYSSDILSETALSFPQYEVEKIINVDVRKMNVEVQMKDGSVKTIIFVGTKKEEAFKEVFSVEPDWNEIERFAYLAQKKDIIIY